MARKIKMRMSDSVLVYADASYCSSTAAWGYGYCIIAGQPEMRKTSTGGGVQCVSSQKAELMAIQEALAFLSERMVGLIAGRRVEIRTDCLGAIAAVSKEAQAFIEATGAREVTLHHVKSHGRRRDSHSHLNYLCHCLAKQTMARYRARVSKSRARTKQHRPNWSPQ